MTISNMNLTQHNYVNIMKSKILHFTLQMLKHPCLCFLNNVILTNVHFTYTHTKAFSFLEKFEAKLLKFSIKEKSIKLFVQ